MRLFLRLLFFFITVPFIVSAQSNFKPGYIVTLKGDTLRGEIDSREWVYTPETVKFKQGNNSISTYSPADVIAFGLIGTTDYISFKGNISVDEAELSKLHNGLDSTKEVRTVFLQVITKGKLATLYKYADNIKTRFLLSTSNKPQPEELIRYIFVSLDEAEKVIYTDLYKRQLTTLALEYKNEPSFIDQIQQTPYSKPDLIRIINKFNGTTKTNSSTGKSTASKIGFFAGAGINMQTIFYRDIQEAGASKYGYLPLITGGIDLYVNPSVHRIVIRGVVGFTGADMKTQTSLLTQEIKQYTAFIEPQFIYHFYNKPGFKVYAGIGGRFSFSGYPKVSTILQGYDYGAYPSFTHSWFTGTGIVGILLNNKIEIQAGGILPTIINTQAVRYTASALQTDYNARVRAFHLGVNYHFK